MTGGLNVVTKPKIGGRYWYIFKWEGVFCAIPVRVTGSFEGAENIAERMNRRAERYGD